MDQIASFIGFAASGYCGWIVVLSLLTAFELANPNGKQSLVGRLRGVLYWAIYIPLAACILLILSWLWSALGVHPLLTLPVFDSLSWLGPLAAAAAVLVAAIIGDFFFYTAHRIQHRWLWRYHAVHHSIRDLNAVNSYHHVSETIVSQLFYGIPLSLVVTNTGPGLPFASLFLWLHIVWIHSPTRITLGPLRAVLVDNRFHRIHHSLEERHFDKNFGAFTTLWDRLFGTAYFPERDEWPDVGLAEVDEPRGVGEWLDLPDRYAKRTAAGSAGEACPTA
jgi:sterol desaturase/sphingolipid hydroxylase (fatty acid hydroxylase superfamily)